MLVSNVQEGDNQTLGTPNLLKIYIGEDPEPISKLQINTTYNVANVLLRVKNESTSVMRNVTYTLPENMRIPPGKKLPDMLNPGEEVVIPVEIDTSYSAEGVISINAGYLEIVTH